MSVVQYADEFLKLSRYAPHLIPDEETKAERFRDGLSPQIREKIDFLEITNYFIGFHLFYYFYYLFRLKWCALPPFPRKELEMRRLTM
jgi:hypothetical protein